MTQVPFSVFRIVVPLVLFLSENSRGKGGNGQFTNGICSWGEGLSESYLPGPYLTATAHIRWT